MCHVELDSAAAVWHETTHKARKAHRCNCCHRVIRAGEDYRRHFSVFEGETTSQKCCSDCQASRTQFEEAHGGVSYAPGDFAWALNACIAEGDEESDQLWTPALEAIRARQRAATETP